MYHLGFIKKKKIVEFYQTCREIHDVMSIANRMRRREAMRTILLPSLIAIASSDKASTRIIYNDLYILSIYNYI